MSSTTTQQIIPSEHKTSLPYWDTSTVQAKMYMVVMLIPLMMCLTLFITNPEARPIAVLMTILVMVNIFAKAYLINCVTYGGCVTLSWILALASIFMVLKLNIK
jgi:hypothetical protein